MTAPPQISAFDIQARVGAQSFQRGRDYADSGRIIATRRQDSTLQALCLGSQPVPYRLNATITADGTVTEADCTCPVGDGGYCKHVAALLLTWLKSPAGFTEALDLETALAEKSKEELIDLLMTVSSGNPQFEQLLETALGAGQERASLGAEFYRQQVETAIEPLEHHWDFSSGGYGYGGEVPALVDQADERLQREDWSGAADIYRGVLAGIGASEALAYDEEGSLVEAAWRCITGLGLCLEHLADPAAREPLLDTLFEIYYTDISEYGGIDLALGAPEILTTQTTPEERDELIERVRDVLPPPGSWSYDAYNQLLLELEAEKLSGEEYLERCRELGLTDRLVDRLLSLGREAEAVAAISAAEVGELNVMVPIFASHGHEDLIEPVVQRWIDAHPNVSYYGPGPDIEAWLMNRYESRGEHAAALAIALRVLAERGTLEAYREARELAQRAGEWPEKRQEIMNLAARRSPGLKALIHLEERELDEAIAAVGRRRQELYYPGVDVPLRVAEAVAQERPDAALDIYLQRIAALIEHRGRENYGLAAALLSRMRNIYDNLDRFEEWEALIARLRSENYRLPAFQDELDKADL